MKKAIRDLEPGNEIKVGHNKTAVVKSVSDGYFLNSKIVVYADGLRACYFDSDPVTVVNIS
jgi:hypothetical protein